jgi:hypothetical protein
LRTVIPGGATCIGGDRALPYDGGLSVGAALSLFEVAAL